MIIGVGVDVCPADRWNQMVERRPGIVRRLLTESEAARRPDSQAARFAAKEALAKALGSPGGLAWLDAEVVNDGTGRPCFALSGSVQSRADELGVRKIHLSLSHDAGVAVAMVICEG